VFEEIAIDARRAIAERRAGIPEGTLISHRAGVPANDTFTPPGQGFEPSEDVRRAASSEMERRNGAPAPKDESAEDELARKRREFDEMLERERKGGSERRW
jgi:hypothetical protein